MANAGARCGWSSQTCGEAPVWEESSGEAPDADDFFVTETLIFDALVIMFSHNNYINDTHASF